jgi:hypothetical protein
MVERALEYVQRHQNSDGGFFTWLPSRWSSIDVSIHSVALASKGRPLEAALDYLRRKQLPSGGFKAMWHFGDTYSTAHAILELGRFGESKMITRALRFLERTQREDGGWGTPEETGMALMALIKTGSYDKPVDAGVRNLVKTFDQTSRSWPLCRVWVARVTYSSYLLTTSPIIAALHLYLKAE